jgi:hypothetical protein
MAYGKPIDPIISTAEHFFAVSNAQRRLSKGYWETSMRKCMEQAIEFHRIADTYRAPEAPAHLRVEETKRKSRRKLKGESK